METQQAARIPKYRADIKGEVATIKQEARDTYANEISNGDSFPSDDFTDYDAYREYEKYLTDTKLKAAFKSAWTKSA